MESARKKFKSVGIILAAGSGKRMNMEIPKQYMILNNKPLFIHSVISYQESKVDEIIVVVSSGEREHCRDIVDKFKIKKKVYFVEGGSERYLSVYNALKFCESQNYDIVSIHDCARPMITKEFINKSLKEAFEYDSSVLAVSVKDTVKRANKDMFVEETLDRDNLYIIQTPQSFKFKLLKMSYDLLMENEVCQKGITDDAMVVERMTEVKVKLTKGFYENIKITTQEDIVLARVWKSEEKS